MRFGEVARSRLSIQAKPCAAWSIYLKQGVCREVLIPKNDVPATSMYR